MKKQLITSAVLIFSAITIQAQSVLTEFGFYENFSSEEELITDLETERGLFWRSESLQTLTRNSVDSSLDVVMSQPRGMYTPFSVSFGDSNGALTGGAPYTIDLSGNGTFSFDIVNTGTDTISVRVACIDTEDRMIDCSPGALNFGQIWMYQTQVLVLPGETVPFAAGSNNNAGGGIKNNCDFAHGVWGDYGVHLIRTDCNLRKIKGVNITVLNGQKDLGDGHALALENGEFSIKNIMVGDTSANAASAPIVETNKANLQLVNFTTKVVTSQKKIVIENIPFNEKGNSIRIINIYGQEVYAKTTSNSTFELSIANFPTGIYHILLAGKVEKLIIK